MTDTTELRTEGEIAGKDQSIAGLKAQIDRMWAGQEELQSEIDRLREGIRRAVVSLDQGMGPASVSKQLRDLFNANK